MASTHDYRKWMRKGDSPGDAADTSVNVSRRDPPAANQPLSSDSTSGALHPEKEPSVHPGVHNARKPRSLPVILGKRKRATSQQDIDLPPFFSCLAGSPVRPL